MGRGGGGEAVEQLGPVCAIGGLEQARHRHGDLIRIAFIEITVSIHEPTGLGEDAPSFRVLWPAGGDVGMGQDVQYLQETHSACGRGRRTDLVLAIGRAERLRHFRLVGGEICQRQPTWNRAHLSAGNNGFGQGTGIEGARALVRQGL